MKYNYGSKKYISARESLSAFELVCLTENRNLNLRKNNFLMIKFGENML